ncbi:MAG: pyridoxal phosphate-dependent aminotransferase [Pseudomonadales bacterium]
MSEYNIGKSIADVSAAAGEQQIHKLSSNENPFGASPLAQRAITDTLASLNYYPPRTDSAITEALAAHFGRGLTAANFVTGNGAVDLINLLENACFESAQSNSVVICPPCFGSYAATAKLKGATVIEHPLNPETFELELEGLQAAITDDTRLLYLCNPNNPTGSYFDQASLQRVLDILPAHVTLVYDEVYYHYATEFEMPDALGAVLEGANLVILHSFSKAYGLAGLRMGYAIASEAIIAKLSARKLSFQNDSVSLAAMQAALGDTEFLAKTVDNNTEQRAWLREQMSQLGLKFWPSQANFICFEAPAGRSAADIVERLISFGVMVRGAFIYPITFVSASACPPPMSDLSRRCSKLWQR